MVYSKKIIHGKRVSWGLYDLLVDGMKNQTITNKLFISIQTVRNHIRHIYDKLQVHSKSQAVVKAIREGLVYPPLFCFIINDPNVSLNRINLRFIFV